MQTTLVEARNTKPEFKRNCYPDSNIVILDEKVLKEGVPNCVWVEGEQDGIYGIQKIVSTNDSTSLTALPTLKDLNKLEIGKYYRVELKKIVHFGERRKKIIDVEEIDNKTYNILSQIYNKRDLFEE